MPAREADALVKSVQSLATEKARVAAKERQLVVRLGAALIRIGYRVVPIDGSVSKKSGRDPRPRRGRRRMSAAARKAVSRRMKAYWAKRRGRSAKAKPKRPGRRRAGPAAS